jgi:multidrug efflux pump subunit AcrB
MNIAQSCIDKKIVTYLLSAVVLVAGVFSYFNLGRLEDPEFTVKNAQIITLYPGATAEDVAEQVTDKIETAVQQMGQLKRVTSTSYTGKSIVMVEMKDQFGRQDLPQIWDELRRKVTEVQSVLPEGCMPSRVVDDYGNVSGVFFAIYGDGFTYAELKEHVKLLRRELLQCQDVARIDILGDQQEVIYFEVSRARCAFLGIRPEMIESAIAGQNQATPAGRVKIGDKYIHIYPDSKLISPSDLGKIILSAPDNPSVKIRLEDIATIYRGYQDPPQQLLRYNGKPCIGLGISTVAGGNVITMGQAIDTRLKELMKQTPVGIEVGVISHQAKSVDHAVKGFVVNLVEAVVIVIAVLLFAMGMRSGLLIGGVLLLTVMGTILVMDWLGILFERISLGAFIIALGMLVDNAIVITEAVLIAAQKGEDRKKAAVEVVRQTMWPLLGATVVAILSFAPIGASNDSTGEFCRSLFLVLLISLLLSWVTAITITPLTASWFITAPAKEAKQAEPYSGAFFQAYRALLISCIRHRYVTTLILLVVLALSLMGFGHVKQIFFPSSTRPQFMVHVWMPLGTHISATDRVVRQLEAKLRSMDGITGVTSMVGTGGLRFLLTYTPEDPDASYGILFADVKDYNAIPDYARQLKAFADAEVHDALVYSQQFVLGPGDPQKIQLRILGPEPAVLRQQADAIMKLLQADPKLVEIQTDWRNRVDVIEPVISEAKARTLGMTRATIAAALQRATEGTRITTIPEGDEAIPLVMRPPASERLDPNSIYDVWTWSPLMECSVPVAQMVERFANTSQEARLKRRNRLPCITVKCNTTGETPNQALQRLMPKVAQATANLPNDYRAEWGGEYESSKNANGALGGRIPPIILLMFLVVVALFNSFKSGVVIFMTVPLVVIGVTLGLLGFDQPFGFMALLGFLSLIGMQIKNAIVLIDEIQAQQKLGVPPVDALVQAGVSRLRPVAMSTVTTVLGMLPLLVDAFYSAMAVTIMCGLTFATVLTMIVIPVNYAIVHRLPNPPKTT